jgi:hypothetical protein
MRGDVTHMGERRGVHNVLVGKGRRHLENLSADERITLKWILKSSLRAGTEFIWYRISESGRLFPTR